MTLLELTKLRPEMTPAECAYAAGLMDGEGCFTVLRRHERTNPGQAQHRPWYVASVQMTTTTPEMVEWLRCRWGGSIHKASKREIGKDGSLHRQRWQWVLTAKQLEPFLADVQPYLVVKQEQCRLLRALRAVTIHRGQARTGMQEAARAALSALHERIYLKSQALKRAS